MASKTAVQEGEKQQNNSIVTKVFREVLMTIAAAIVWTGVVVYTLRAGFAVINFRDRHIDGFWIALVFLALLLSAGKIWWVIKRIKWLLLLAVINVVILVIMSSVMTYGLIKPAVVDPVVQTTQSIEDLGLYNFGQKVNGVVSIFGDPVGAAWAAIIGGGGEDE